MGERAPQDSTIAIVGDGFGSLIVYSTAVYLGFRPDQIAIYGPNDEPGRDVPAVRLQPRADRAALRVRVALPARRLADVRAARRVVAPQPRAAVPLRAAEVQPRRPGDPRRGRHRRSAGSAGTTTAYAGEGRLDQRASRNGDAPHFVLFDEDAQLHRPREARDARAAATARCRSRRCSRRRAQDPELADRIVQAYEPKTYDPGGRYIVIGSGIASVNEWANAIDVGREVHLAASATRRRTSRT